MDLYTCIHVSVCVGMLVHAYMSVCVGMLVHAYAVIIYVNKCLCVCCLYVYVFWICFELYVCSCLCGEFACTSTH